MTEIKTAHEFGKVRVFQLSFNPASDIAEPADYDRLADAMGLTFTKLADVQIVTEAALHDLGLAQFLMIGHGIAEDDITPQMTRLNALKGSFAIIRSGAFGLEEVTFTDTPDAKWIATFNEEGGASAPLTPLTSEASEGMVAVPMTPSQKPKSDARIGGMVATVALFLMGLLVWLMIWIGS